MTFFFYFHLLFYNNKMDFHLIAYYIGINLLFGTSIHYLLLPDDIEFIRLEAFINLIGDVKCNYLILSYNNEGLLNIEEIKKILLSKGAVKLYKIKYTKFKSQEKVDKKFVEEYIWVVDTTKKSDAIIEIEMELN